MDYAFAHFIFMMDYCYQRLIQTNDYTTLNKSSIDGETNETNYHHLLKYA